jgi:hypothetical protein
LRKIVVGKCPIDDMSGVAVRERLSTTNGPRAQTRNARYCWHPLIRISMKKQAWRWGEAHKLMHLQQRILVTGGAGFLGSQSKQLAILKNFFAKPWKY